MSLIVDARDVRFTYEDGTEALRGITFQLEHNATVAWLGPNGSGKTTFAHHLNGLLRGAGSIVVDGLALEDSSLQSIRQRVGLVFQDSDNQLFMPTVIEDVAFSLLASGMAAEEARAIAQEALRRVGLSGKGDKAPWHLSAGEKKRAAIAGVLAGNAKLLVLDEPTTFLDPPGERSLASLLKELPQAKILITHNVGFARTLTDTACFFREGQIESRGEIDRIVTTMNW